MRMNKSAHAKDAVLEILKKIQGSLADLRNGQADQFGTFCPMFPHLLMMRQCWRLRVS